MRRLGLAVAVVAVSLMAAPAIASADTITPTCTVGQGPTQPCGSGWYGAPVFLSWTWSPLTSGSGSCQAAPYTSDTVKTVSCTVSWTDGFIGTQSYTLHVETSSPTATVAPNRPPDSGPWYNHPVASAVSATAFSGIASCTSTTYAGPSSPGATVSATCIDNAGKTVSATSAPFAYDATPPTLTAAATAGGGNVALSWQSSGDIAPIASIDVVRTSGAGSPQTVYSGTANGYNDTQVSDGTQYTYIITARDVAGNAAVQTVSATPQAPVLTPLDSARILSPPLLRWTPVRRATYYNVQLYRNGKKVLSIWPAKPHLQLQRSWRHDGRKYTLKPGKYRWFVWPGFGKRSAGRYGHRIGSGSFVVVR
jgi:hypothetical protein